MRDTLKNLSATCPQPMALTLLPPAETAVLGQSPRKIPNFDQLTLSPMARSPSSSITRSPHRGVRHGAAGTVARGHVMCVVVGPSLDRDLPKVNRRIQCVKRSRPATDPAASLDECVPEQSADGAARLDSSDAAMTSASDEHELHTVPAKYVHSNEDDDWTEEDGGEDEAEEEDAEAEQEKDEEKKVEAGDSGDDEPEQMKDASGTGARAAGLGRPRAASKGGRGRRAGGAGDASAAASAPVRHAQGTARRGRSVSSSGANVDRSSGAPRRGGRRRGRAGSSSSRGARMRR